MIIAPEIHEIRMNDPAPMEHSMSTGVIFLGGLVEEEGTFMAEWSFGLLGAKCNIVIHDVKGLSSISVGLGHGIGALLHYHVLSKTPRRSSSYVVRPVGIEPTTISLKASCSTN